MNGCCPQALKVRRIRLANWIAPETNTAFCVELFHKYQLVGSDRSVTAALILGLPPRMSSQTQTKTHQIRIIIFILTAKTASTRKKRAYFGSSTALDRTRFVQTKQLLLIKTVRSWLSGGYPNRPAPTVDLTYHSNRQLRVSQPTCAGNRLAHQSTRQLS